MSVEITYKKNPIKKYSSNLVLFCNEKHNISGLKNHISSAEYSFVSELIKSKDLKKDIISFDINSKRKIILVSLKKNLTTSDTENLGAKFFIEFKDNKQTEYNIDSDTLPEFLNHTIGYFLHGLKLKSYTFDKYKT